MSKMSRRASRNWQEYEEEIRSRIERDGIETYREWSITLKTMIRGITPDSIIEKQESARHFGERLPDLDGGTSIQQAHLLAVAEQNGINLSSIRYVTEIGGGLCRMLSLADKLLPNLEWYTIYDLPAVSQLQDYIISNELDISCETHLITDIDGFSKLKFIEDKPNDHLLLSSCGFSEIPVELRKTLMVSNPSAFKKYAMRIQKTWDGVDNLQFLQQSFPPSWSGDCVFTGHSYVIKC